jgi:holo-[acyl-carrier protein] synthase
VVQGPLGRPGVVLHGEIAERAERAGLSAIDISLTHTGDTALAVAVATVRSEPEVVA